MIRIPFEGKYAERWCWTFYQFRTHKGDVTIRWCGESNGYYGVDVRVKSEQIVEGNSG